MKNLLARSNKAKARFTSIKERGGVRAVLKTEGGAIDLASIMVGVLVIGIIGGVIAATVFSVIPWSQDEAAKGALDSVNQAQSVAFAFNAGKGEGGFATLDQLTLSPSNTLTADGSPLLQDSGSLAIVVPAGGATYTAYFESQTGKVFSITSADPSTPQPVPGGSVDNSAFTVTPTAP